MPENANRENHEQELEEELALEDEELVPEDDAIIGKAFRWSLLVIAVLAIGVASALYFRAADEPADEVREINAPPPAKLDQSSARMPEVRFSEITRQAGITFVHNNGARGGKFLPETMGAGAAFFDYDGDGDQDLLFVNGTDWPWSKGSGKSSRMALYANDGKGGFSDVTRQAGLTQTFYGMGVAAADYDNDGDPDLFITAVGPNHLFRNDGGRFVEVTPQAKVAGGEHEWSASAGFLDYDNDGLLDLFVCNYVQWSREIDLELNFTLNGTDRAYGPPTNFKGTHPYLYHNNGDGTFSDVSASAGIQVVNPATGDPMAKSLAFYAVDLEGDGLIDIAVSNDTVQNFLFHNNGDGTFQEMGMEAGLAFDFNGQATGAMGIDGGYHRNDKALAIGIGNFANEMSSLYVSQEDPTWFADESIGEGVGSPSRLVLSFGLFFFDYDLDGRLDLLQANGHLEEEISQIQASQHYEQPTQLYWNRGAEEDSCFLEVPAETLGDLSRPIVGRAAAYGDIDGDGDLDVVLTQAGRAPLLLRNDQQLGHHWIRVHLRGTKVNRDAIGAWVEVLAGGVTQKRPVMPTRSYLSQMELPVTIGLGENSRIDSLTVIWPDGSRQKVADPHIDTEIEVVQQGERDRE